MKLREFKFNPLKAGNPNLNEREGCVWLCVVDGEREYMGFIAEVLNQVMHLADREVESTSWYFNTFVIRLKEDGKEDAN